MISTRSTVRILLVAAIVAVAITPMVTVASAQGYPPGMVAYWRFDEGSGAVASDSVGGNDGAIYGATWTAGRVGGALHFDGVDDRVEVAYDPAQKPESEITVEVWVYPEDGMTNHQVIVGALLTGAYQTYIAGNRLYFNYYYSGADCYAVGPEVPALHSWHHVVVTYEEQGDSATSKVYVDGVDVRGRIL